MTASDSPNTFVADIVSCTGSPVQRIIVQLQQPYTFLAGQYLNVLAPDISDPIDIPLSIASAPQRLPQLELHYRSTPGAAEARAMDALLEGRQLTLSGAAGAVNAGATQEPLLIVAGGSGAAQAFSCAEDRGLRAAAPTTIVWCADDPADIYELERLRAHHGVTVQVCVDDRRTTENEGMQWLRKHGAEFLHCKVILAGSPGFVYAATDALLAAGVEQQSMHADAYAYAPR